jgi:hypothetical protein
VRFPRLRQVATKTWFRALVAAAFLAFHVFCLGRVGQDRLGLVFNSAPGQPPTIADWSTPMTNGVPANWNRLILSRWDSQHYMGIAIRGFSQCPRQDMRPQDLSAVVYKCDFSFYPGYAVMAHYASLGEKIPIDFAMMLVSFVTGFLFLFWFTSPVITSRLGVGTTYLALLLFNLFPTGFMIVTLLTEPPVLAFTLGGFVAIAKKQWIPAALLAGAATAMRVSGAAAGAACGLALLASFYTDRPKTPLRWTERVVACLLAPWGLVLMMGWYWYQYYDPLLYVHSHASAYKHMSSSDMFPMAYDFWLRALNNPSREVVWIAVCLLVLAMGCRRALAPFELVPRVYMYALAFLGAGISLAGSWNLGFLGMNRYWLLVLPLFFSLAVVFRRYRLALVVWLAVSGWFYWNVEACDFLAQYSSASVCKFR